MPRSPLAAALSAVAIACAHTASAGAASPCGTATADQAHAALAGALREFVQGGVVDYAGLHGRPDALGSYFRAVAAVCRADYDAWPEPARLAFWIDVYNAGAIRIVLDHWPVQSIRAIGLLPMAAFRAAFIRVPGLFDHALSLDEVENEILRKRFRDPRVHFAIVCASKSCPRLRDQPYRGSALDRQLDEATRAFVRDGAKNRWDPATRTLFLSSIFKWFRDDFERDAGSLPAFVARYLDEPAASDVRRGVARVEFLDYDWSLNGR